MPEPDIKSPARATDAGRVFYFNAGFLRQAQIRRIMELAGYPLRLGKPEAEDHIAVWGHSPFAKRGEAVAGATGANLIRVEDAFLRSLFPGRDGEPPLGLVIDTGGAHFNSAARTELETLLATHPLDDTALMNRARAAIARLKEAHLTKYTGFMPNAPCPEPGYVLVVDQTRGDASVTQGGADANTFREMLYYAQEDNPGARIIIKTHPETQAGHREGYFTDTDASDQVQLWRAPVSPWPLFEGATAVYTVSSQMGFEAIFADHKPHVFGQPFYAGWGLTEDRHPLALPRRGRRLSRAQFFAASMILYPKWYDPYRDRLCQLEDAIEIMHARTQAWREDHAGWVATGMRLWKRRPLQQVFGTHQRVRFDDDFKRAAGRAKALGRRHMAWAGTAPKDADVVRVEDGFLRSRGLGAALVPALSLVCDDLGIYYDPARESRLEHWISARADLRPDQAARAEQLVAQIRSLGLSKYNLGHPTAELPKGHRILVPGQVENDASVRLGAGDISTNLELLQKVRAERPDAALIYKPHPDVEARLREGHVPAQALNDLGYHVLEKADPATLLTQVQEVWTMTSLMGFEALLRGVAVTTTGAPFYAGWGLTRDLGDCPTRRTARPDLLGLVHASLIDYPRYFDPQTGAPCPVEVVIGRLARGDIPHPGAANRILSKLQGVFASYAGWWR